MEYFNMTAHQLSNMIKQKEISSTELTKELLDRIEQTDDRLQSYLCKTPETALECAKRVDEKIAKGEEVAPLSGIPMALKDNICTDKIPTTCASKMLEHFVPPYDAFVVKKLKEVDAPMLGKLNMDEFAMGSSTESSYFQKTKNPYHLDYVPGGSSGGSAAAVSAGLAVYALGSDTGGSIRQPASYCGIVGFKPTYGLVSRFGVAGLASSLDQVGTCTKDITDCAMVLNAIAGHDPLDSTSAKRETPDYTACLDANGAKGMKIAVPSQYLEGEMSDQVKASVLAAIETYQKLGAEVEYVDLFSAKYVLPAYSIIMSAEASSNLARFDGIKYGFRSENYEDLVDLYEQTRAEGFGMESKRRIVMGTFVLGKDQYERYYKKAQQVRTVIRNEFETLFQKYDVVLTPTALNTAFRVGEKRADLSAMSLEDVCLASANLAGIPAVSVPCGFSNEGLPIGLQLIGKAFDEQTVLKAAYAFEQNTEFHKKRPTL